MAALPATCTSAVLRGQQPHGLRRTAEPAGLHALVASVTSTSAGAPIDRSMLCSIGEQLAPRRPPPHQPLHEAPAAAVVENNILPAAALFPDTNDDRIGRHITGARGKELPCLELWIYFEGKSSTRYRYRYSIVGRHQSRLSYHRGVNQ